MVEYAKESSVWDSTQLYQFNGNNRIGKIFIQNQKQTKNKRCNTQLLL